MVRTHIFQKYTVIVNRNSESGDAIKLGDVDGDYVLTTKIVAFVLQKVLDEGFRFLAER